MPILEGYFTQLAALTEVASDSLRVLATLLATYPLALIFKSLPPRSPGLKHLFSFSFAAFVFCGMFEMSRAFYSLLALTMVCYAVSHLFKGKWAPRLVFLIAMGHLGVNQIARQVHRVSLDKFEHTGPEMVLVMKLTSFAFSVYDGQRPLHELTPRQQSKRITRMPSILEFLGYAFFFAGFLVGPAFEFMDYREFTTMEIFRASPSKAQLRTPATDAFKNKIAKNSPDDDARQDDNEKVRIYHVPNGFFPAMRCLAFGLFWVICTVIFARLYSIEWTLSEEYKNCSFLYRLYYVQIAAFCARFKFYIVWLFAEGACILAGLGFNGYDNEGRPKWDRVTNIDVIAYETANNIKTLIEAWNMNTNKWLKNYVYLRITPPGARPTFFSTFATFGTSALWHGFYPGYYLTFVTGAFVQSSHRALRRNLRPIFLSTKYRSLKPLYDLAGWFATQATINYVIIPFLILSLRNSLYVWKLNYFIGHIALLLIHAFFSMGGGKMLQRSLGVLGGKREQSPKIRERGSEEKVKEDGLLVSEVGIPEI